MHQYQYSLKCMLKAHLKTLTLYGGASKQWVGGGTLRNELNDDRCDVT